MPLFGIGLIKSRSILYEYTPIFGLGTLAIKDTMSARIFQYFFPICLAFASLAHANNKSAADITHAEVMQMLRARLGETVELDKAPELYTQLGKLNDTLKAAQLRKDPELRIAESHFLIMNSEVSNAANITLPGPNGDRVYIVITTALLRRLQDYQTKQGPREGKGRALKLAVGALAHEWSHLVDIKDSDGLSDKLYGYGRAVFKQAIELKTNLEVVTLLREAGYPTNAGLEYFEASLESEWDKGTILYRLKRDSDGSNGQDTLEVALRTHPPDDIETTAYRFAITANNYERGRDVKTFDLDLSAAALRELDQAKRVPVSPLLSMQTDHLSVREVVEKLLPFLEHDYDNIPSRTVLEFNHWLMALDEAMLRRGEGATAAEITLAADFYKAYLTVSSQGGYPPIVFGAGDEVLDPVYQKAHPEKHLALLQRVPAYHTPQFRDAILSSSKKEKERVHTDDLEKVLPQAVLAEQLKQDWLPIPSYQENRLFLSDALEFRRELDRFERMQRAVAPDDRVLSLFEKERGPGFLFTTGRHFESAHHLGELLRDSRLADMKPVIKQMARELWRDRARYAVVDRMWAGGKIDWERVFDALGIRRRLGWEMLRRSAQEFVQSQGYADLYRKVTPFVQTLKSGTSGHQGYWLAPPRQDLELLSGLKNPYLEESEREELSNRLKYAKSSEYFRDRFLKEISDELDSLASEEITLGRYNRMLSRMAERNFPGSGTSSYFSEGELNEHRFNFNLGFSQSEAVLDLVARAVDRSNRLSRKKEILNTLFVNTARAHPSHTNWMINPKLESTITSILIRNGVFSSHWDLIRKMRPAQNADLKGARDPFSDYFSILYPQKTAHYSFVAARAKPLLQNLKAAISEPGANAPVLLQQFASEVIAPFVGTEVKGQGWGERKTVDSRRIGDSRRPEIRELTEGVLDLAAHHADKMTLPQKLEFFERITALTPSTKADIFFRRHIEKSFIELIQRHPDKTTYDLLEKLLYSEATPGKRLISEEVKVNLVRAWAELNLKEIDKREEGLRLGKYQAGWGVKIDSSERVRGEAFRHFLIYHIDHFLKEDSDFRDQLYEELGWKAGLTGQAVHEQVERNKRANNEFNALGINQLSAVSHLLHGMSGEQRLDYISYLMDPHRPIPTSVEEYLEKHVAGRLPRVRFLVRVGTPRNVKHEEDLRYARQKVEDSALATSTADKAVLIEWLLTSGEKPLWKNPDITARLSRDYLKYGPGSAADIQLRSFLEVVAPEERSVSLAYMLAHSGQGDSPIFAIFKAFGPVGAKAAQGLSTWGILGPELSEKLAKFKDEAPPLTLKQVEDELDRTLSPKERAKIKRPVKILGSASLKNAVLVELVDGRKVVVLLRRPGIEEQIKSHIALAKRYVAALEHNGLKSNSPLIRSLIYALDSQLGDEKSLLREAAKINRAQEHYKALNKNLKRKPGANWKIEVPGLVPDFTPHDNLLVIDYAPGKTLNQLGEAAKKRMGPMIVEAGVRAIWDDGWMNADSHSGNFIVDEKSETIYALDFGQEVVFRTAVPWRADDRTHLAEFALGLRLKNTDAILDAVGKLATRPFVPTKQMKEQISAVLESSKDFDKKIVDIINALGIAGVFLRDEITFGGIKGMMVYAGERYVDSGEFQDILGEQVQRHLKSKWPFMLRNDAQARHIHDCVRAYKALVQ